MNIDGINKWLALIANLGVIAGVFFLSFELRQNTDVARTTSFQQSIQNINDTRSLLITDPELGRIYDDFVRGDPSSLTDSEVLRLRYVLNSYFGAFDNAFSSMSTGIMPIEEWERFERGACGLWERLDTPEIPFTVLISLGFQEHLNEVC